MSSGEPIPEPNRRVETLAPWVGGVAVALPVLLVTFPPMADLPLHEASVSLLRHWGDAAFFPHDVYFINPGQANQLFSILMLVLSYAMPIAWAAKVSVALTLVALPVATARLADHLGAPRWTALVVAPLGIGWLFFWGLVQNLIGLTVLLALLPSIDRFASNPTRRGAAAMCAAMALLHFAHQAMQICACIALVACSLGAPVRLRETALRAAPLAFSAVLLVVANTYTATVRGPRILGRVPYTWDTHVHKLWAFSGVLFGGFELYVRNLVFVLALAPLGLLLAERIRLRTRERRSVRERLHAARFEIFALILFIGYVLAPATIGGTTLVYHRFLPPAWAVFAVCCAKGTAGTARPLSRWLCALAPVGSLLISWPVFVDADQMYSDLDALMTRIETNSAVAAIDLGPHRPVRLWGPVSAMGHVVALRGGRSLFDYTQSPVSPVAQRPEMQWPEAINRIEKHPFDLIPSWDLLRYRYLLVITSSPSLGMATALALRHEARFVGHEGDWYLFESRILNVPINARDAWPPQPRPPSVHDQLQALPRELDRIEHAGEQAAQ